jgi:hypothetical protein
MDLDRQIAIASRLLYFVGIVSVIHWLTSGLLAITWVLGSGATDLGSAYVLQGDPVPGYVFEAIGIAAFFLMGYGISKRYAGVFLRIPIVIIADGLGLFNHVAPSGVRAAPIGILASFLVVFHAIVLWFVLRAIFALRQISVNNSIVRRMRFEAELRRKLAESDEPPPPAAKFDTRFHGLPPTG